MTGPVTTVTGMTSAAMLAIANGSVVSGTVTAGHLILTTRGGSTIDAGSVIGPTGSTGATGATSPPSGSAGGDLTGSTYPNPTVAAGAITLAKLAAAVQALLVPTGSIQAYGAATAPTGWLLANGAAVSRTTYSALYALIGTTYGIGDGSTTFNLPNLKGRLIAGIDSSQTEFNALAKTGGEKTHLQTLAEMPQHVHIQTVGYDGASVYIRQYNYAYNTTVITTARTALTGSAAAVVSSRQDSTDPPLAYLDGTAFNVLNPYITLSYIIKT